jgi:hypothetical protein
MAKQKSIRFALHLCKPDNTTHFFSPFTNCLSLYTKHSKQKPFIHSINLDIDTQTVPYKALTQLHKRANHLTGNFSAIQ